MTAFAHFFRATASSCLLLVAVSATSLAATAPVSQTYAAENEQQVRDLVRDRFSQALAVLGNKSLDEKGKEAGFRKIVQDAFHLPAISRFVLGRYWRKASEAEITEYNKVFEDYVVKTYVQRLAGFTEVTFEVTDVKEAKKDLIVTTEIKRNDGGPDAQLNWRMKEVNGDWKVVDVIIEGISMALSQRSEFGSIIQQNGGKVSALIDRLKTQIGI